MYYSHVRNMRMWTWLLGLRNRSDNVIRDGSEEVQKQCKRCKNPTMLKKSLKEYNPVSTHDEIWVNKDSVDYVVQFTCPKCGYSFRSEYWAE